MIEYPYAPPKHLEHLAGITLQGPSEGTKTRASGIIIHMDLQSREEIGAVLTSLKNKDEKARDMMGEFQIERGLKPKFDPYNHPLFNRGGGVKESITYEEVREDGFILVKA